MRCCCFHDEVQPDAVVAARRKVSTENVVNNDKWSCSTVQKVLSRQEIDMREVGGVSANRVVGSRALAWPH
jgi:hypothetical protein